MKANWQDENFTECLRQLSVTVDDIVPTCKYEEQNPEKHPLSCKSLFQTDNCHCHIH